MCPAAAPPTNPAAPAMAILWGVEKAKAKVVPCNLHVSFSWLVSFFLAPDSHRPAGQPKQTVCDKRLGTVPLMWSIVVVIVSASPDVMYHQHLVFSCHSKNWPWHLTARNIPEAVSLPNSTATSNKQFFILNSRFVCPGKFSSTCRHYSTRHWA